MLGLTQASGFPQILKTRKEMTRTQGLERSQSRAQSLPAGPYGSKNLRGTGLVGLRGSKLTASGSPSADPVGRAGPPPFFF